MSYEAFDIEMFVRISKLHKLAVSLQKQLSRIPGQKKTASGLVTAYFRGALNTPISFQEKMKFFSLNARFIPHCLQKSRFSKRARRHLEISDTEKETSLIENNFLYCSWLLFIVIGYGKNV